jgi:hypothetical protein
MKIADLIAQLEFVKEQYGDLECAVYADSGIQPVKPPRVHVLQDFDFGSAELLKNGRRLAVLWSKPGIG